MGGGKGQIAFVSNRSGKPQIWIMNVDGSDQRQLTNMPEGACQPAWSPDGNRLAFISPCNLNQEVYLGTNLFILDVESGGITPLPSAPGGDFDPAWSPDGTRIAFSSFRDYYRKQIYLITLADLSIVSLSANKVHDSQPAWSPDGMQIAFVSERYGRYQIWLMNADGSEQRAFSRSGNLINLHPVWSPDGQSILYTQTDAGGGVPRVMVSRLDEEPFKEIRIAPDLLPMREATFSPDGHWIVYESWPDGINHDIYIMSTNGVARLRLTTDSAVDFDPAWRK
jgi:tol-pal system beta propeller repeat protein TolB